MRDTLPKQPWKSETGILNLDINSNKGTHWVAYKKVNNSVTYFDSFGDLIPPVEFQEYMKNCKIRYNYTSFQRFGSTNCGQLSLKFLNSLLKGIVYKYIE